MEALKLNESELRYFGDLFSASDVENTGKVSGIKAAELFKMSQLSSEVLQQVSPFYKFAVLPFLIGHENRFLAYNFIIRL